MYVLLRWDIGHWVVGERKSDSTLLLTSLSVYVTHKSGCWNGFRENFPFISQSVFLQTVLVMWTLELSVGVYYLKDIYYLNVGVQMLDFILLSCQRGFWKSGLAGLDIHIVCHIPYTWLSKYDKNFCHKTTRMFSMTNSFSLYTPSSYQEIFLMYTIRREIAHYSWTKIVAPGTLVTLKHTCNHLCIMSQRAKAWKQEYNFQLHFSLFILTSEQNLYVMMMANNLWQM
jgi:hypothetical protein